MTSRRDHFPTVESLIIFADIIDSSVYSSILGITQYAEYLQFFQKAFKALSAKYFGSSVIENARSWTETKGDEGVVFCVAPGERAGDLIYNAVKFSFELKALLEFLMKPKRFTDKVVHKMKVGIGIHYGEVATVLKNGKVNFAKQLSDIDHLEGYTINYTKRVETASRAGRFSKIFLSGTADSLIKDYPVITERLIQDLSGISKNEDVYEIRSAYLRDLSLDYPDNILSGFIETYMVDDLKLDFIHEPWLKSFVLSVFDSAINDAKYPNIKKKFADRRSRLAWHNRAEDDPILLFVRAVECEHNDQHSARVRILTEIASRYPTFLYARKQLVRAYAALSNSSVLPAELVYARDIAREFIEKFEQCLNTQERREFQSIIASIEPKLSTFQPNNIKGE